MKLERYSLKQGAMVETPNGSYVRYTDHVRIVKALFTLLHQTTLTLKVAVKTLAAQILRLRKDDDSP